MVPFWITARRNGSIVACLTFASIRMKTSPERCNMPRIGGFSFANVPRPRAPFGRRLRGFLFFFYSRWLPLVVGDDIDLVAFDFARKLNRRPSGLHTSAEGSCHLLNVILIQVKLGSYLPV